MSIFDEILKVYPDLTDKDFSLSEGSILLKDDGDGIVYIAKWNYSKPLPSGLKIGK